MSKESEGKVREAISNLVNSQFEKKRPKLVTNEMVDGWIKFTEEKWLILELEEGQKHPTTNVLKLLHFLNENPQVSIILAHVYFPNSAAVNSSRGRLAAWLGSQMEQHYLPGRFYYRRLIIDRQYTEWIGAEGLLEAVSILKSSQPSSTHHSVR
jgi:hypothetical protein